jgi:uncharacterized membrane protein YeaQ/YmgE (transglycosylase-associated protein family)
MGWDWFLFIVGVFLVEFLIAGVIVGWLASLIFKGLGLRRSIVVGVIGAIVGGWLLVHFDVLLSLPIGPVIDGAIGAAVLLVIVGVFYKPT